MLGETKNYDELLTSLGSLEILDWDKDRVELTWSPPESDGGAPIEKYIVEKREKGKIIVIFRSKK